VRYSPLAGSGVSTSTNGMGAATQMFKHIIVVVTI
jgi:hypothetical protein